MNSELVKARANLRSLLPHKYRPLLGPFTDTWDDLVNDNGDPLHFGMHYTNAVSSFCEHVKPRDVKMALVLLNYLFLEHHTVENSSLVDSAMLLIKESSEGAGVHLNSIGNPNVFKLEEHPIVYLMLLFIDSTGDVDAA